jgi:DNA-binding ferritin-like protein
MAKESPTDKLLEASGLQRAKPAQQTPEERVEQMERLFKGMMEDVKKAVILASQAQGRGESMIESLKKYCKETLPKQMVEAIDEVAEQGVQNSLKPLDEAVERAVAELRALQKGLVGGLEECRKSLDKMPWYQFRDLAILALGMGVGMGFLVRCQFVGDKIEENKRYEVWGRKVEKVIENPRNANVKKTFYEAVGGRP